MDQSNEVGASDSSSTEGTERKSLSIGDVFDALKHPRRRYVLYYFTDRAEGATLAELADWIADFENGDESAEHVATTLFHTHLPKLDEYDLIDYDREEDLVTRSERAAATDPYLEFAADYELVPN